MARLAGKPTLSERRIWEQASDSLPVTFKPKQVFVLMPMEGEEAEEIYRALKAACSTVDLFATRVDEKVGASIIMQDIDRMMGEAEFLIFDLSNERPNVYYELGYAHGIGNHSENILLLAREGTRIAFNVAPLRVQFYRSLDHLQYLVVSQLRKMMQIKRRQVSDDLAGPDT